MMYLCAKDSGQSPAEQFYGKHGAEATPYATYSINRLVTDWGRYVENKLNERSSENKPVHEISRLLRLNGASPASSSDDDDYEVYVNPYAHLSAAEKARLWEEQTSAASMSIATHTVS